MKQKDLLAEISRSFLKECRAHRYRSKKISEMTDDEVVLCCHRYCEENGLTAEWKAFRKRCEEAYRYCSYAEEYVDEGLCYDLQMILGELIKPCALPESVIDKEKLKNCCADCKYRW